MKIEIKHPDVSANFLLNYLKSPEEDASILKGVSVEHLDLVLNLLRQVVHQELRVMYRGPRKGWGNGTLKRDAVSASVYFRERYEY